MIEMRKFQYHLSILLIFCSGVQYIKMHPASRCKLQCQESKNDSTKLRFVNVVLRHGDRTTDPNNGETYANDPNKNFSYYPDGYGQLTNVGKNRAYDSGKLLRKLYNYFLGETYYISNVYARSTGFSRCKTTLQLVLAGLYPPADIQKWNPDLLWQPVDVIYNPIEKDALLLPFFCSLYKQVYANVLQSKPAITEIRKFNNFMKEISTYTGRNITNLDDLWFLYQTLDVQLSLGLSLPEWSKQIFPHGRLFEAVLLLMKLRHYNNELIRLNGGVLLYKMIKNMKEVINNTLMRKINIFVGHDINLIGLLNALGVFDNKLPAYASGIMIELREKNNEYFVKIRRFLSIPQKIIEVVIPGCDALCPFDKFVQLTSETTATSEDPACQTGNNNQDYHFKN